MEMRRFASAAAVLLAGLLVLAKADSGSTVEPTAPEGWWHALVVDGSYCRLAAYPPKAAVGTSRVACKSKKFDHNFLFRLATAQSNLSRWQDNLTTDSNLQLRSFNLIATYTTVNTASKDVVAGVSWSKASDFTVEAYSPSSDSEDVAAVSLQSGAPLRLAARQGGYCARAGGSASWLRCSARSWKGAGKVQLPYSSYWGVQLVNQLTHVPCAAQLPSGGRPGTVVCSSTQAEDAGGTWVSTFGFALQTPGRPRLYSGNATIAIKAYGAVFHYNVWTWAAGAATPFNVTFTQGTADPGQWLEVVKMYGRPGQEEIMPGDVVTLRSKVTQQFCGVWSRTRPQLVCDVLSVGLLDTGYQFQLNGQWLP